MFIGSIFLSLCEEGMINLILCIFTFLYFTYLLLIELFSTKLIAFC